MKAQIYEFDLRNFFGGVDLAYNQKEMERLGIPSEIAEYLRKINESIVKLAKEDKIDESQNRLILWNSNGDWNPNLDPEVRKEAENPAFLVTPEGAVDLAESAKLGIER